MSTQQNARKLVTIEDLKRIHDDLRNRSEGNGNLIGLLTVNLGDLEGDVQDAMDASAAASQQAAAVEEDAEAALQTAGEVKSLVDELNEILEANDLNRLNRPNMLKANSWYDRVDKPHTEMVLYTVNIPAETAEQAAQPITATITNEALTADCTIYTVDTEAPIDPDDVALTSAAAGSATITIPARTGAHEDAYTVDVVLCEHAIEIQIYGNTWWRIGMDKPYIKNVSGGRSQTPGVDPDVISAAPVALETPIIDPDDEEYTMALAFTISQANTAWGNVEEMCWLYGNHGAGTFREGGAIQESGNIKEMVVGETYTMSFWARVTNGSKALVRLHWNTKDQSQLTTDSERAKWITIDGSRWKRYYWTFVFAPTGNQYTDTVTEVTEEVDGQTVTVNETKRVANWYKDISWGISRKYAGTVQLTGFRLVHGELHMHTLFDELDARIAALEAIVTPTQQAQSLAMSPSPGQAAITEPEEEETGAAETEELTGAETEAEPEETTETEGETI